MMEGSFKFNKMILRLIFIWICTLLGSSLSFDGSSRILGGNKTLIRDYPYQLSIRHNEIEICGGALISLSYGLSAAHCFIWLGDYSIRAGSTFKSSGGIISHIDAVYVHPKRMETKYAYDIAILKLASSLPRNEREICGGVLIGLDYALSAAHCFERLGNYSIRAGSTFKSSGGIISHINAIYVHPKRMESKYAYDIVVLKLASPLPRNEREICGGVLIGLDYALSAAHCFERLGNYSIRAGSTFKSSGGIISHINAIYVHPKRMESKYAYDIVVLKLASPLPRNEREICGGVLIGLDYALSAAHCFERLGNYSIRAGSTFKSSGGIISHINAIYVHPKRMESKYAYDIVVLKLASPLPYSDTIRPIRLPKLNDDSALKTGARGVISGFGDTEDNANKGSPVLMAAEVKIRDFKFCRNKYMLYNTPLYPHMFCAGSMGKDSCQGDSGGPFVRDGVLYGLVSFGFKCGDPKFPGIYTKISYFRDFIKLNSGI